METLKNQVQDLLEAKKKDLMSLEAQNDSLNAALNAKSAEARGLMADTSSLGSRNRDLKGELADLNASCNTLKQNYEDLKANNSRKMRNLINELETLQEDLGKRERRLNEVERQLNQRDSVMNALRNKLSDALLGFRDKGLTVNVKDGKVYVSLSNQLLFKSGSTKVDPSGKEALQELAKVLIEQSDISIMVEGHTDDVPVRNLGDIKDNWDLSVMRSTEVVRILTETGLEPTRVIPSGRSEYLPVDGDDSKEARARNRRTEIILSPKLDVLYNLINEHSPQE